MPRNEPQRIVIELRHHCLSAIEVVRTEEHLSQLIETAHGHHCLSAIEVVRTVASGSWESSRSVWSPLPVGN